MDIYYYFFLHPLWPNLSLIFENFLSVGEENIAYYVFAG